MTGDRQPVTRPAQNYQISARPHSFQGRKMYEALSDFGPQSYQNVSRETFWYDWREYERGAAARRYVLFQVRLIGVLARAT
ncbi:MAG: hypothetical protein ACREDH_01760, partial [Methylocella sp.]